MKTLLWTAALIMCTFTQMFAMSTSSLRNHARFLSDRMAYELDLTPAQYDDVYEINFDFFYLTNRIMDDVVYGYRDAIDRYYDYLDDRNDDIRYVLTSRQYKRFLECEYFYRPLYSTGKTWSFRIYTIYSNRTFFYFDAPIHFKTYIGEHSRIKFATRDYYMRRYERQKHDRYAPFVIRHIEPAHRNTIRRNDFGAIERHRHDTERNRVNNYSNHNSHNRTDHKYYRDESGNRHSPDINHRNHTDKNTGKADKPGKPDNKPGKADKPNNHTENTHRSGNTSNSRSNSAASRSTSASKSNNSNNNNNRSNGSSDNRPTNRGRR